jgi:biotin operon repressor
MGVDGPARRWTKQEIEYLRAHHATLSIETLSRDLNRSIISIQQEAGKLHLPDVPKPWTKKDDAFVRKHYGTMKIDDIAQHLGRTWKAVVARGGLMNLRIRRVKITPAMITSILEKVGSVSRSVIAAELGITEGRVAKIARENGYVQSEENWWQNNWRSEDDLYIREHYSTTPVKEIARHLGRSPGSVTQRILFLKLSHKKSHRVLTLYWTREEDNVLHKNYRNLSNTKLAAQLGRTRSSVKHRLKKLGLYRIEQPRPAPIPWTPQETALLRKIYTAHSNRQIAQRLGRTAAMVEKKLSSLGLRRLEGPYIQAPFWTPEEVAQLRKLHGTMSIPKIAEIMGRSRSSVSVKLKKLHLTKPRKPRKGDRLSGDNS